MVYKKDYEGYENNNIHNNKDNVEFKQVASFQKKVTLRIPSRKSLVTLCFNWLIKHIK